jgi:hypothetical protein
MHAFDTAFMRPLVVACETLQEALTRADQARQQVAMAQAELAHYEAQALALAAARHQTAPCAAAQRPVSQR